MNPIEVPQYSSLRPQPVAYERRRAGASGLSLMVRMLDEIDYGLLLVTTEGDLRYANQLALQELASGGPLRLAGERLAVPAVNDMSRLAAALADTVRGLRTLISLGHNGQALPVAVTPIHSGDSSAAENLALLVFNKRAACAELTLAFYARSKGLTATETTVLQLLSRGLKPKDIARSQRVKVSTIRSQIGSIREKTHTASIGELISRVAGLPPFAPVVKSAPFAVERAEASPLPGHAQVDLASMVGAAC